jgi:hypothetical protein
MSPEDKICDQCGQNGTCCECPTCADCGGVGDECECEE